MRRISMKISMQIVPAIFGIALLWPSAEPQVPQVPQAVDKAKEAWNKIAPRTDEEIRKCISDKLADSPKLKTLGLSATVTRGEATLKGDGRSGGNKNAAANIAKRCGAKSVVNDISIPGPPPPKK
jgi:osmotically-inducible protein OsmY